MLQLFLRLLMALSEIPDNFTQTKDVVMPSSTEPLRRMRRVVGGNLADVRQVPYLVNLRRNGVFECGGALLTPKCVLTAAHCIKDGAPADFIVRGGVTYLNDVRNSRRVQRIFRPTKYDSKTLEHDVAVFQLDAPLEGNSIEAIRLSADILRPGDAVRVSGWGLTSEQAINPPNQMRIVDLRVMSQQECQKLYMHYRNVSDTMFCASVPGYKDACAADSGGPAVLNGRLVGVVSWGKGYECARAGSPGVYVKISEVRPWIESTMTKYCY